MASIYICEVCRQKFKRAGKKKLSDPKRFCSLKCYWKSGTKMRKNCLECDKEFKSNAKKFCSIGCRDKSKDWRYNNSKAQKERFKINSAWNKGKPNTWSDGEKSNFYIDGRSPITRGERRTFMNTLEYVNWRREVFARDNFTCQICGIKGGDLRANHIKKYVDYPNLRIEPINGITICRDCDIKWVLNREKEWESYFNFNLMTRRLI